MPGTARPSRGGVCPPQQAVACYGVGAPVDGLALAQDGDHPALVHQPAHGSAHPVLAGGHVLRELFDGPGMLRAARSQALDGGDHQLARQGWRPAALEPDTALHGWISLATAAQAAMLPCTVYSLRTRRLTCQPVCSQICAAASRSPDWPLVLCMRPMSTSSPKNIPYGVMIQPPYMNVIRRV